MSWNHLKHIRRNIEGSKKVITVKRILYIFFENFFMLQNYKNKKTRAYNKKKFITKKADEKFKRVYGGTVWLEDCSTRDDIFFLLFLNFSSRWFFFFERTNHFLCLYIIFFAHFSSQPCQHEKCFGLLSTFYSLH